MSTASRHDLVAEDRDVFLGIMMLCYFLSKCHLLIKILKHEIRKTAPPGLKRATANTKVMNFIEASCATKSGSPESCPANYDAAGAEIGQRNHLVGVFDWVCHC